MFKGLVVCALILVVTSCRQTSRLDQIRASPYPELASVNACLQNYDVIVYVGDNGRFRLAGDINRMQEIVDGECGPKITQTMHRDFASFFSEVDRKIVEYIFQSGGNAEFDPKYGISVDEDSDPDLIEKDFLRAYEYYRIPRPAREDI